MATTAIADLANRQLIEKSARIAADENLGPGVNPYKPSLEAEHWINTYNAQIKQELQKQLAT